MKKSESIKEISVALAKFQEEVTNPKNTEVNNFFKSKYTPLGDIINHCRPILAKNNLAVIQDVNGTGEDISITTLITHSSGEWIESSELKIKNQANKGVSDAQSVGISITYARRYSLSAALGIASEDDIDGNNLNQTNNSQKENKLTDAQINRLYAIGSKAGFDKKTVQSQVKQKFNIAIEKMSKQQYDAVCNGYEKLIEK